MLITRLLSTDSAMPPANSRDTGRYRIVDQNAEGEGKSFAVPTQA
jgi:hypothetical protein